MMTKEEAIYQYLVRIADNSLILGHRLSEWCSKGPILEEDIALTNIALDKVGQARYLYQYACEAEGKGKTEDDLAYKRTEKEFHNSLLVEQPNGDYAQTIVREFFNDNFDLLFFKALSNSKDEMIAALAKRFVKEVSYHLRHSTQWVLRIGDGTEESHQRAQDAVNFLWMFTGELFEMDEPDGILIKEGIAVDLNSLKDEWTRNVTTTLKEATLEIPEDAWMQTGGKKGIHSEHLGYILAELQYYPSRYPDAKW